MNYKMKAICLAKSKGIPIKKVHVTSTQVRFRQRSPTEFKKGSFRTLDIGQAGGFKAIIGKPKGSKKTRVQSFFISKREL